MNATLEAESPLVDHVRRELDHLLHGPEETIISPEQADALVDLARAFTGHSGGSAGFGIGALAWALRTAMSYEPLTDLSGADDEWVEVGPGVEQNRRCGRVFRENGRTHALDCVVWTEVVWMRGEDQRLPRPRVIGFTGWDSARHITLPGVPPARPRRVWHRLRWVDRSIARLRGALVTR